MRAIGLTLIGLALLLYPVVIYFGLERFSVGPLAMILIVTFAVRFLLMKRQNVPLPWLNAATVAGIAVALFAIITQSPTGLALYPVAINVAMLGVFAHSLYRGPTVIETLARLREPGLSAQGIRYTRRVTQAWCLFFVINSSVAAWTALVGTREQWLIYNGLIAYLLIGLVLLIEWLIRRKIKAKDASNV